MSTTKIVVIAFVAIAAVVVILIYRSRRSSPMPLHLKPYFKSKADYKAFLKRQQELAAQSSSYFADGAAATGADVVAVYRQLGLKGVAGALEAKIRPCFHLVPSGSADKPLSSRIGGLPDLPRADLWPQCNGKSLAFVAQVNLKTLPAGAPESPLPRNGMLLFFYDSEQATWGFDPNDKGSWAVIHCEELPDASPSIDYPEDVPDHARYKAVPVNLLAGTSIPNPDGVLSDFALSDEQQRQVTDVYGQFAERRDMDQLLGYAAPIQGDMQLECQLVSHGLYCGDLTGYNDPRAKDLAAGALRWRLLLQVDSHEEEAGMMWGDGGRLYFWITEDDLRNRRFDNVWMILQCY